MDSRYLSQLSRVFDSADPYLVSEYVNRHVGRHDIRTSTLGLLQASLKHRKFAEIDICRIGYGSSVRVTSPALDTVYHLQVILRGTCLWRRSHEQFVLAAGELLVINPDDPVDLTYSDDCEKLIIKIPVSLVEATCLIQHWALPLQGVRFTQHRYQLIELGDFVSLLAMVCTEAELADSLVKVREHFAQIVVFKILTILQTNLVRCSATKQQVAFDLLVAFIARNIRRDLRSTDLAAHAHISLRTLYGMFERLAQTTPKHFIRQQKLEHIHRCLVDSNCSVRSITELAMDYGFIHLGRFAKSYKLAFGQLPSDTLKQRRQ